jgi:hypothetical protein
MKMYWLASLVVLGGAMQTNAQVFQRWSSRPIVIQRGVPYVEYCPPTGQEVVVPDTTTGVPPPQAAAPALMPSPPGSSQDKALKPIPNTGGPVPVQPCDNCPPATDCTNCYPPQPTPATPLKTCVCTNIRPSTSPNPYPPDVNPGPVPTVPGSTTPQSMYSSYVCFTFKAIVPACTSTTTLIPQCTTIVIKYDCCAAGVVVGSTAAATCQVTACVYDTPKIADTFACAVCTKDVQVQARIRRCGGLVDIVAFGVAGMPKNWILAFGLTPADATAKFGVTFGTLIPVAPDANPPSSCP